MEKRLSVAVKKIVGQPNPKEGKWSGCLVFEPEAEARGRGRLFAVLDLSGSPSLDLARLGKEALEELRKEYYASSQPTPLAALGEALHKAQHRLVKLIYGPEGAVPDGTLNYNFVAAALWGSVLCLSKLGTAAIYLRRGGELKELGVAHDSRIFTASGMVHPGDLVILGSAEFRHTFPPEELEKSAENLEALVSDLGKPPGISVLLLRVGLESVPGKEEVVEIAPAARRKPHLKKLVLSVLARIRSLIPSKGGEPEVYVEREFEGESSRRKRKTPKALFFVIALLFLLASAFTIKRRQELFRASEAARLIAEAEQAVADARQYVDLNNSRARELLQQAERDLRAVEELGLGSDVTRQKLSEITTLLDKVNRVKRLKDLEIFYDLKIQNPESSPTSLVGDGKSLFVTDPSSQIVYRLSAAKAGGGPEVENAAGQKVSGARVVRIFGDQLFILGAEGVSRLDLRNLELSKNLVGGGFAPEDVKDVGTYFGNVYLLVPGKNQILKAVPVEGGEYSLATDWVASEVDISDAVAMAIDGFIYVLRSDGNVLKFEKGKLLPDFGLRDLDRPLSDPRAIFTTTDSEHLYLLDAGNKRIVITDKDGLYQSQYLYEGDQAFNDPKDLFVDEAAKTIYLLDGTKIFRIGM